MASFFERPETCSVFTFSSQHKETKDYIECFKAQFHLFHDSIHDSHYLIAWTMKSNVLVFNVNCAAVYSYKSHSQDYHFLIDKNGNKFGLKFKNTESAKLYLEKVVAVLHIINNKKSNGLPPPNSDDEESDNEKDSEESNPASNRTPITNPKVNNVKSVKHEMHVTQDRKTGKFIGLPDDMARQANKQFAKEVGKLFGVKLPDYEAKIPIVLVMLKKNLKNVNGYKLEGIFRVDPNQTECKKIKLCIDSSEFDFGSILVDGYIFANLIKMWFRELPNPLLNNISSKTLKMISNEEDVIKIIQELKELYRSIFLWLCDLCVECTTHEIANHMSIQNLARMFAPNMFDPTKVSDQRTHVDLTIDFLEKAFKWRQANPSYK